MLFRRKALFLMMLFLLVQELGLSGMMLGEKKGGKLAG
jgi:hypothetical protein